MMTRRDWWLGVLLVLAGLFLHALLPRYEYHYAELRGNLWDRWTGQARMMAAVLG